MAIAALFKDRFAYVRDNSKLIARFLLAALFLTLGAWFFKHQQAELGKIKEVLLSSKTNFIIAGIAGSTIYIFLQGLMYKMAFASVKKKVTLGQTTLLFLKRNLVSIFMPAGGVTSLAFFSGDIDKSGNSRTKIHFASSIYAFIGILSVAVVSVPVIIYALVRGFSGTGEFVGLAVILTLLSALFFVYRSIIRKRLVYKLLVRYLPSSEVIIEELISHTIVTKYLVLTIITSLLIDFLCIGLLYTSTLALGIKASLLFAMLGYVIAAISMIISPFMRGLGAVEVSLSLILTRFGYTGIEAVAITILYRIFEFWVPMVSGALSFLLKLNKFLVRIFPALLIFILGIVNIVSAVTPAISERVHILEDFIPISAIAASNFTVLIAGVFMLLTAVYMFRGLRNAWWIAVVLCVVSLAGHITKAIDYEEASMAFLVLIALFFSRKEYYVRSNPRLYTIGISTAVLSIAVVIVYGTIGFYLLDKRHFGLEFNLWESISNTIRNFILIGSPDLDPLSHFAKYFLSSIKISGFLSMSFLLYTVLRPHFANEKTGKEKIDEAISLVEKYGRSGLDYFKTYNDKVIFKPSGLDAFISFRTAGTFAVALEDPVAKDPTLMKECIRLFDEYCFETGLKSIFYRVPEESLPVYRELSKKTMLIGQEGIVDLNNFTISGARNKALRNAINKVMEEGYHTTVHTPPVKDGLLQKLKAVSDDWLQSTDRKEIVFSQGMFIWEELKKQTIITVESPEEKVIAFLNIIPDYAPQEATYDLIRKTEDAPHGVLDFIMVELFNYLKFQNYTKVNLGFAPMSGLDDAQTFPERSMRFAYEKIRTFSHYRGLRNYKEKFNPVWYNRYLIYSDDYDLLQIPSVLVKVIRPDYE